MNAIHSYDEFGNVLKTRLYRYTGKEEAMFYSEEQIVAELERLEEINYVDE